MGATRSRAGASGWWEHLPRRGNTNGAVSQMVARAATVEPVRPGARFTSPRRTEEDVSLWDERAQTHHLGDSMCFFPRPFRTIPTEQEWQDLPQRALAVN